MGGGGERKGGDVRDPNLQALSLESHQDDLCLLSHWNCVSVCICVCMCACVYTCVLCIMFSIDF